MATPDLKLGRNVLHYVPYHVAKLRGEPHPPTPPPQHLCVSAMSQHKRVTTQPVRCWRPGCWMAIDLRLRVWALHLFYQLLKVFGAKPEPPAHPPRQYLGVPASSMCQHLTHLRHFAAASSIPGWMCSETCRDALGPSPQASGQVSAEKP